MRLMLTKTALLALLLPAGLGLTGCGNLLNKMVPDIYMVDRHTIMEADAAGDWPALEQRLRQDVNQGPQPFSGVDEQLDRQAAFRVLNDEYAEADGADASEGQKTAVTSDDE